MKMIFLFPVALDARCHKRLQSLKKLGVQPKVLAFERDLYLGKFIPGEYKLLGKIQHRKYVRRFLPFVKVLPRMRATTKDADVIYAFGLDLLLLGWLASLRLGNRLKIIYEVADIREVLLGTRLVSRFLRRLERFLLRKVDLLVVTSEAFISEYYRGIQGLAHLRNQVIENKLEPDLLPQVAEKQRERAGGALHIGYFGIIRCPRSWAILKLAARKGGGRVKVYVRGIPMGVDNLEEESDAIPHIKYDGPYVSPHELPEMYGQIDIVWIVAQYHEGREGNLTWARTNRFYEACYFQRSMIAQIETQDGRVVEEKGLGVCLDLGDIEGAVARILSISDFNLDRWRKNLANLPERIYVYTDEHKQLCEALAKRVP